LGEVNAINDRILRYNEFIHKCQAAFESRRSRSDRLPPGSKATDTTKLDQQADDLNRQQLEQPASLAQSPVTPSQASEYTRWPAGDLQRLYNGCTDSYNKNKEGLRHSWAFVSSYGNDNLDHCRWVGGSISPDEAIKHALEACRKDGYSNCSLYSTNSQLSDWVKMISNNGGRVPGSQPPPPRSPKPDSSASNDDLGNALGTVLGAFLGAAGKARSQPTYAPPRPTYTPPPSYQYKVMPATPPTGSSGSSPCNWGPGSQVAC
jgi:hypothetical protein